MLSEDEILNEEANGHSIFGASKWHRLLVCSASVLAEIGKPDTAGWEAYEGTVAHDIARDILDYGWERTDLDFLEGKINTYTRGEEVFTVVVSSSMLNYITEYADWCRALPGDHHVEQRVDFSRLTPIPNQGGTADHFAMEPGHLTITDLKYGTGVQVFAEKNPQAIAYALGVIYEWDWLYCFDRVTIRICQPRLAHFDVWETTVAELMEFATWAKDRLALTWDRRAPYTPTETACKFCKARGTCPAAITLVDRLADASFEDTTVSVEEVTSVLDRLAGDNYAIPEPDIKGLTLAQLGQFLRFRKVIEHHLEAAYKEMSRRVILEHEPAPDGWMIAQGKASRSIGSRTMLTKLIARLKFSELDLYTSELKSPAQLEAMLVDDGMTKAQAVKYLEPAITSTPGKPSLSLVTPGKKAAIDLADSSFDDESETDL